MPINTDRANTLNKVRALIAKADDVAATNPAEADVFRAKADALMLKYSIEIHELQSESERSREVEPFDVDMSWYMTNPHKDNLWVIMQSVARHCRVALIHWKYTGLTMPAVGTGADYEYFDMLFTNVMLEMSKGLEPHPDPKVPMIENLVRMKESGMKWERIGELLISIGQLDEYTRNVGVRFTKLYTDYCTEHSRPRLRTAPAVYARSFALGFQTEIGDRLFKIRREAQVQYDAMSEGRGTDLVLADIKRVVEARALQLFGAPPRSSYSRGRADNRKIDSGAVGAGREAARNVDLGSSRVGTTRREIGSGS